MQLFDIKIKTQFPYSAHALKLFHRILWLSPAEEGKAFRVTTEYTKEMLFDMQNKWLTLLWILKTGCE